ncbi:ABC transporter ATP-binding protein [Streptococcus sp. KCJ4932]|uniref:ABC transporter ATP-binding protein n=1 Tax=Streptococcus sp. KCJ4932 TaxID=2545465 RepID=UPI0019D1F9D3|nr:ABC transporter ATP-binding protein [Streptococcus sp. KCJ4932]
MKVYKKLFSYVPEFKYLAYLAILLAALSTVFTIGAFYDMYLFLNHLIVQNNATNIAHYAKTVVGFMMTGIGIYLISGLLTHIVAFRLETNLRKKGIDALSQSNFAYFDTHTSGYIRKTIDDNAAETHTIVAHLIPDNTTSVMTLLLLVLATFAVNVYLGLALILLAVVALLQIKQMMGDAEFMDAYMKALEKMNSETVEYVRGMQVIKIFKTSVQSFKALYTAIKSYSDYALNYSFSCRTAFIIFQVMFATYATLIVPIYLYFVSKSQQLTLLPKFIFFYFAVGLLYVTFMRIMYVFMYQYKGSVSAEKIETLYNDMTSQRVALGDEELLENGNIIFDHVSFGYEDQKVIDNLSFELEENKVYAFVGSSGSGKSTIAKLIAGHYRVDSGSIKLGGKPIESYSQDALMRQIAFVFQQSKLFKMSIFDNVKIGNPNASDEEVMKALELASCEEILDKFPEREQTMIGSKGVYLSGGEKQRIAIARAILKDAKIVILDEASASTDVNNEYQIQKAFANLIAHKMVIIIAHRLSSIKGVDDILVIDKGQIIERGNSNELLEKGGKYKAFSDLYALANEWRVS